MKTTSAGILSLFLTAVTASTVFAAADPAAVQPPPATAPVARSAPRVEVFAFSPVSAPAPADWTGRGIQENLQSDVSRSGATLVLAPQAPAGNDDMIAAARQNHADLAVTGTYQVVGDQIRANGHLIDVATQGTVGGFSATGNQRDLFKVEDALGEQLRALLPRPISASEIRAAFDQPQQPVMQQDFQTVTSSYSQPAPVNNYYYDASPVQGYYYPDYSDGYDYPYGLGVYGGFGFYGRYGYDRGGRGFYSRGFSSNPSFHNPVYRGSGGVNATPAAGLGRSGFGGGSRGGGGFGGVHGGGGGGRR